MPANLVERLQYRVNNPSAWDSFDQSASDDFAEAAAEIERLEAEVARCHARLEIDHYFKMGGNDYADLERVELPIEERGGFPDGITARNATIELIEDNLRAAEDRCDKLAEALLAFAFYEDWMDDHSDDVISPVHKRITFGDLRRAREALEQVGKR